jgi:putative riboflavin transport system substrate-binding protein
MRFGSVYYVLSVALLLAACGGGAAPASSAPAAPSKPAATSAPASSPAASAVVASKPAVSVAPAASTPANAKPAASGPPTALTVALGYIPNVQFAPFYVAQAQGFYKGEGIDVSFDNGISPDLIKAVGAGKFKVALADADTVISAREQSIPVTYVAGYYDQSPSAIISLPAKNIRAAQDLKGKKIGLPGRYGSSYIGLLAVLTKAGLTEKDVDIQEIGFNQAPQLLAGKVDAVVGYANNDAIQVQAQANAKPNVILVGDVVPFVPSGLVANDDTLKSNPALVQSAVRAMVEGVQYTVAHPDDAVQTTVKVVPEAGGQNLKLNQDVLNTTISLWQGKNSQANGQGWTDPAAWKAMEDTMVAAGIVKTPPPVDQAMTNKFITK